MKKSIFGIAALTLMVLCLSSCAVRIPDGATAVQPFDLPRYMGTWYEIARFDFRQERNLEQVTATYTLQADGNVKVVNKGFHSIKKKWKEAVGKAKPVGSPKEGRLKVSFFGPFYAGYNVVAITPDYEHALVVGNNKDYIWFLSRQKTMPPAIREEFLAKAKAIGYDVSKLIWTKQ